MFPYDGSVRESQALPAFFANITRRKKRVKYPRPHVGRDSSTRATYPDFRTVIHYACRYRNDAHRARTSASRKPTARSHPRKAASGDCVARWRTGIHARSAARTAAGRAPGRTDLRSPCACPWPPPPNRFGSPAPSQTCLPLQHAQQLHQSAEVKPAPNFDATATRQCHRQTAAPPTLQRRADTRHLYRNPAVSGCCLALRLPLSITGQRGQAKPVLAAEFNPAQPAAFVLARHLLGFRASPPAPNVSRCESSERRSGGSCAPANSRNGRHRTEGRRASTNPKSFSIVAGTRVATMRPCSGTRSKAKAIPVDEGESAEDGHRKR